MSRKDRAELWSSTTDALRLPAVAQQLANGFDFFSLAEYLLVVDNQ